MSKIQLVEVVVGLFDVGPAVFLGCEFIEVVITFSEAVSPAY